MWIVPSACEVTPLWESLQEDDHFVLQKNNLEQKTMWGNLVGTLQALFDVRQAPYRILIKTTCVKLLPGDAALTIAVGETRRDIETDWEFLKTKVSPSLSKEHSEAVRDVCARVEELVSGRVAGTDEAAQDERFRATARAFRQTFSLSPSERLVNYYSCSMSGGILSQGWLYISEHYLAYYSYIFGVESKILLELKSINQLKKERSKKTLPPDTISVTTADGREFRFSNLFHRDETYDLLQSLINRSLQRILRTTRSDAGVEILPSPSLENVSRLESPLQISTPTLKEGLEKEKIQLKLQNIFNISRDEELIEQSWCMLWTERRPDEIFRGQVFLTRRYLLFTSQDAQAVIPACAIRKMEKVLPDPTSKEANNEAYIVAFTTCHHHKMYMSVGGNVRNCDRFCFRLKEILLESAPLSKKDLVPFLATLPSEQLILGEERCASVSCGLGDRWGYPGAQTSSESSEGQEGRRSNTTKIQGILLEYWASYFSEFGRNVALLRTDYFPRLIRAGLPNRLRAEIWEVCCGSIYMRFDNPELYHEILSANKGRRSIAIEEIEKDLHR